MKKKSNIAEFTAQELQARTKGMRIARDVKDHEIDYSDIPKFTKEQLKKFKPMGRPLVGDTPRKAISIRIESGVLEKLKAKAKKQGIAYQTLINEILKKGV